MYLRVPVSQRHDLAEWRSVLQNIMESSATATRHVLSSLSQTADHHSRVLHLEDTILLSLVCFAPLYAAFMNCKFPLADRSGALLIAKSFVYSRHFDGCSVPEPCNGPQKHMLNGNNPLAA